MKKKRYYFSLLIVPITLIIFFIILFLTKLWKPTTFAIFFISVLLLAVFFFTYYFIKKSYLQYEKEELLFVNNDQQRFWKLLIIGFIADFCDTIGIGSFAVSIVLLKITKQVRNNKRLLGIMNLGHTIPTCLEAMIFIALIKVEWLTLVTLISAAVVGAYIGAILANKIKLNYSQLFIGILLFITSLIMLFGQKEVGIMPKAGDKNSLQLWWKYLTGFSIFIALGAFMSLGIGIYAPAMAVCYLLGLSADCAFPIMMGSAAFLMPIAGIRFINDQNYEIKPVLAFSVGGSFGVFTAYLLVFLLLQNGLGLSRDQFIHILLWIVIVVIWYTAFSLVLGAIINLRKQKIGSSNNTT